MILNEESLSALFTEIQGLLCLHVVCLVNQICIAEVDGEGSSTSVMNFGDGGKKNFC